MSGPEFSRPVRVDTLSAAPRRIGIEADAAERADLARRFGLAAIGRLTADLALASDGDEVKAAGNLAAAVTQACVVTGEPVEARIEAPFEIRFRPHPAGGDEEVELGDAELDVIFYEGDLLLNLDPYPRAPGAEAALKAAGVKTEEEAGPFGALAGLRDRLKP
jgi:hypothetical protein